MQIVVHPYDLPDIAIFNNEKASTGFSVWIPDKYYLVLGQSNRPETSLLAKQVITDGVKVFKRPSGGETVILTPKTIVISAVLQTESFENPQKYFKKFNTLIIEALLELGIKGLGHKGISDIAFMEKKILGSSIYRRRNKVFYHAVLNIAEQVDIIARYLQHPAKEPDYRNGRPHCDFVTSLHNLGYNFTPEQIKAVLEKHFSEKTQKSAP